MDDEEDFSRLDLGFLSKKLFFPKFEQLNSGCGLSVGFYGKYLYGIIKICNVARDIINN